MAGRFEEAQVGDVLDGRYTLRRQIARGGQGAVLEGEHLVTRARVAVKTLIRPALEMDEAHARLIREAQILGAVRHPGLVAIHDAGTCPKHGPYLVLEMIEGRPLDGILLTRRKLPPGQAVAIVRQLCDALSEVHHHGIVHRDVKPANLLIEATRGSDRVQLIDFGIATMGDHVAETSSKLTKAGEILGTIEYMAPEQLMTTGPVDARADVYAVGAVLYECLAGELPYQGPATVVMANMIAGTKPAPIRTKRDDVPRALEIVIGKALEIDAQKRYATTAELARACVASFAQPVPEIDLLKVRDEAQAGQPAPGGPPSLTDTASRRRQFKRAPYVAPVRVVMDKGATADGRTEDISEGGLLMVMDANCGDGQRVRVRLVIPVSGRVVELEGTTKWIIRGRAQRAVGLEFIGLPDDIRGAIRSYVTLMTGA
jgi:serine/threonine protein kinase